MKVLSFVTTALLGLSAFLALPAPAPTADKEPGSKEDRMEKANGLTAYYGDTGLHVFYRNTGGSIVEVFRKAGAGADKNWHTNDLTTEAKAPKAASAPAAFTMKAGRLGKHASHHVVYRGTDDQIHELYRQTDGKWEHMNLSVEAKGPKAAGRPAVFASEDTDAQHVFYRTSEGALIDLYRRWGSTDDKKWHSNDLTAEAKAPKATGSFNAYLEQTGTVTSSYVQHLVYRSEDGQIHELYAGPKDKWMHKDLSTEARAPRAAGAPVGYHTQKDNVQHVFYRSSEGALIDLYRRRNDDRDNAWHSNDLTAEARAPKAAGNPAVYFEQTGTVTTSNVQHIVYLGRTGRYTSCTCGPSRPSGCMAPWRPRSRLRGRPPTPSASSRRKAPSSTSSSAPRNTVSTSCITCRRGPTAAGTALITAPW